MNNYVIQDLNLIRPNEDDYESQQASNYCSMFQCTCGKKFRYYLDIVGGSLQTQNGRKIDTCKAKNTDFYNLSEFVIFQYRQLISM